MIRTIFPTELKSEVKKFTLAEIMEALSDTEKNRLLRGTTEIQARLINIKKDVYCIGELLYEVKQTLKHGTFITWIEQTFNKELPYPTAHFYMSVYDVFKGHARTIQFIPTKYLLMITSKEFPAEVVNVLNENPEKISKQGLQQINEFYNLFKNGTIGGSQFLKIANEQVTLGIDIWKGRAKYRLNANMRHSLEFGAGDMLKRINALRGIVRNMAGVFPHDPDCPEHKKLISIIEDTITGLQELKNDLEGNKGFFKMVSTPNGDDWVSNI